MASIGSVELQIRLDRSQLDKELRSLSVQKLTPITTQIKLDTKSLERQIRDLNKTERDCLQIDLCPDIKGFERKLKDLPKSLVDCIEVELCPDFDSFQSQVKKGLSNLGELEANVYLRVDDSRIKDSKSVITKLKQELSSLQDVGSNLSVTASIQHSIDTSHLNSSFIFAANQFRSAGDDVANAIYDKLKDIRLKTDTGSGGVFGKVLGGAGGVLKGVIGSITGIVPAIISPLIKVATAGTDQIIRETAKDLYRGADVSKGVQKGGKATKDFTVERGGEFGNVIAKDLLLYQKGLKGIGEDLAGLSKKASDFLHPEPFFGTIGKIETRFAGFLHDTFYGAGIGAASKNLANDIARPFEQKFESIKKLAYLLDTQVAGQLKQLAKGEIKTKDLSKGAKEVYGRLATKADAQAQSEGLTSKKDRKTRVDSILKDPTRVAKLISEVSQDLIKEADAKALQRPLNVLVRAFRVTSGSIRKMNAIEIDKVATELAKDLGHLIPDIEKTGKKILTIFGAPLSDFGRGSEESAPVIQAAIPGSNVVAPTYEQYYFKRGKETGNIFHDTSDAIAKKTKGSVIAGNAQKEGSKVPARSAEILTDAISGFLFGYSKTVAVQLGVRKAALVKGYEPQNIQQVGYSAGAVFSRLAEDTASLLEQEIKTVGIGIGDYLTSLIPESPNYKAVFAEGDSLNLALTEGLIPGSGKERILEPSIPNVEAHALPQVAAQKEFFETLRAAGIKGVRESEGINEKQLAYVFKDFTQIINSLRTIKLSENVRAGRPVGEGIVTRPTDPNRKFAAVEDFTQLVKTLKSGVSQFKQFAPERLAQTSLETGVAIDPELLGVANSAQIKLTTEITALANQLGVEGRTVKDSLKNLELVSPALALYQKTLKAAANGTLNAAAAQEEIAASVETLPDGALKTAMFGLINEVEDFDLGWIDKVESEFLQAASLITSFTAKDNQFKNRASIPNQVPEPNTPIYDKPTVASVALTKTVETTQSALIQLVEAFKTGATGVGLAVADKSEQALVTRINSLLQKVPGQNNTLEANPRKVNKLSELQSQDYGKLTSLGFSDLAATIQSVVGALAPTAKAAYQIAEGFEQVALTLLPGGKTGKYLGQKVVAPVLVAGAATQIPGGEAISHAAITLAHQAIDPVAIALGQGAAANVNAAILEAFRPLGFIGDKVAGPLTEIVTGIATDIVSAFTSVAAPATATVVAGKIVLKGAGTAAQAALPALSPGGQKSQKLLGGDSRDLKPINNVDVTAKVLSSRIEEIQIEAQTALKSLEKTAADFGKAQGNATKFKKLNPQKAQDNIKAILGNYERVIAEVDAEIAKLSNPEKTEKTLGNKLASVKSKVQGAFNKANQIAAQIQNTLGNQVENAAEALNQLSTPEKTIDTARHGGAIRVDATVVPESTQTGKDIVNGLTKGVSTNLKSAEKSAADLAHGMINTVEDVLGIQSPSKVFFRIGSFIVQGLEKGLKSLNLDASLFTNIKSQLTQTTTKIKDELNKVQIKPITKQGLGGKLPPQTLRFNAEDIGKSLGSGAAGIANTGVKAIRVTLDSFKELREAIQVEAKSFKANFIQLESEFKLGFGNLASIANKALTTTSNSISRQTLPIESEVRKISEAIAVGLEDVSSIVKNKLQTGLNFITPVATQIKAVVAPIKAEVTKSFTAVAATLNNIFVPITENLNNRLDKVTTIVKQKTSLIEIEAKKVATAIGNVFEDITNQTSRSALKTADNISHTLKKGIQKTTEIASNTTANIKSIPTVLKSGTSGFTSGFTSAFKQEFVGLEASFPGLTKLKENFKSVATTISSQVSAIKTQVYSAIAPIKATTTLVVEGISSSLSNVPKNLGSGLVNQLKQVAKSASDQLSSLKTEAKKVTATVASAVETAASEKGRIFSPANKKTPPKKKAPDPQETPQQISARGIGTDLGQVAANTANAGLKTAKAVQATFKDATAGIPEALNAAKSGFSGFKDAFKKGFEGIETSFPILGKFKDTLKGIGLSALGLIGIFSFGDALTNFVSSATNAALALDKLQTSLNFASGGATAGAKNLAFVRSEVDRLKIPLAESQEGFAQLTAATRGTASAGQTTLDIFSGISEASTVLGLSADQSSGALLALTQIASKGTVQAEELRGQLGERIPGAFSIAARAMGVTESALNKMLQTGSVLSDDFFPRFAKQLHTEFGDAAITASGDAQSAIFDLQNQTLKLQESFGKAIQPAFLLGLNAVSLTLKGLAASSGELIALVSALSIALLVKLGVALKATIADLILTKGVGGTLGQTFTSIAQNINNSFTAKLTIGIFGIIEVVKLLYDTVNTELVKSFNNAAESAERAAEASQTALNPPPKTGEKDKTEPPSINFVDAATRGYVKSNLLTKLAANVYLAGAPAIGEGINRAVNFARTGKADYYSYGDLQRDNLDEGLGRTATSNTSLLASSRLQLSKFKQSGVQVSIDTQLKQSESDRRILKADANRRFSLKGLIIPPEYKQQIEELTLKIQQLNEQRGNISKPVVENLNRVVQQIEATKTQLQQLEDPSTAASLGQDKTNQRKAELVATLEGLKQFKANSEQILASFKVDPILAFTEAIRKLNLELAKNAEQAQRAFSVTKEGISQQKVKDFSFNITSGEDAAVKTAIAERDRAQQELIGLEANAGGLLSSVNASSLQPTLRKFGLTAASSVAEIQDIIDNTTEDADKNVLERIKTAQEGELKLHDSRAALAESESKIQEVQQQNALNSLGRYAADADAVTQGFVNRATEKLQKQLRDRTITEEKAAMEAAQIEYGSLVQQSLSVDTQLKQLQNYYAQGLIGAGEFHNKERELLLSQSNFKKQVAQQENAVRQANYAEILALVDRQVKAIEAQINLTRTQYATSVKQLQLGGGISEEGAAKLFNENDVAADKDNITYAREQIVLNDALEKKGIKNAKDALQERQRLNQSLADSYDKLASDRLTQEKQFRDEITKTNEQLRAQLDLTSVQRTLGTSRASLDALIAPGAKDIIALDLISSAASLRDRSVALNDQVALIQQQIAEIPKLRLAEVDAADKRTALQKDLAVAQTEQLGVEKDLFLNNQEQAVLGIEQRTELEKRRSDRAIAGLESEKTVLDLYNASLDRTKQLTESRASVSKAISDAAVAQGESQIAQLDQALEIRKKLNEGNLSEEAKNALTSLLNQLGGEKTELDILTRRQQIEDDIAAKKQAALLAEQKLARELLNLDLLRQKTTAQTAVLEGEIARDRAAIGQLEAGASLSEAFDKNDAKAIKSAQLQLELNNKIVDSTDKQLKNALANLAIQDELSKNSLAALDAQQKGATQTALSSEKLRNIIQDITKAETKFPSTKPTDSNTQSTQQQSSVTTNSTNTNSEDIGKQVPDGTKFFPLALPGNAKNQGKSLLEIAALTAPEIRTTKYLAPDQSQSVGLNRATSYETLLNESLGLSGKKLAQQIEATKPTVEPATAGFTQFTDGLKTAVSGIEQRLDKLIDTNAIALQSPRTLNVSSPQPIQDGARIFSEIARQSVVNAGL